MDCSTTATVEYYATCGQQSTVQHFGMKSKSTHGKKELKHRRVWNSQCRHWVGSGLQPSATPEYPQLMVAFISDYLGTIYRQRGRGSTMYHSMLAVSVVNKNAKFPCVHVSILLKCFVPSLCGGSDQCIWWPDWHSDGIEKRKKDRETIGIEVKRGNQLQFLQCPKGKKKNVCQVAGDRKKSQVVVVLHHDPEKHRKLVETIEKDPSDDKAIRKFLKDNNFGKTQSRLFKVITRDTRTYVLFNYVLKSATWCRKLEKNVFEVQEEIRKLEMKFGNLIGAEPVHVVAHVETMKNSECALKFEVLKGSPQFGAISKLDKLEPKDLLGAGKAMENIMKKEFSSVELKKTQIARKSGTEDVTVGLQVKKSRESFPPSGGHVLNIPNQRDCNSQNELQLRAQVLQLQQKVESLERENMQLVQWKSYHQQEHINQSLRVWDHEATPGNDVVSSPDVINLNNELDWDWYQDIIPSNSSVLDVEQSMSPFDGEQIKDSLCDLPSILQEIAISPGSTNTRRLGTSGFIDDVPVLFDDIQDTSVPAAQTSIDQPLILFKKSLKRKREETTPFSYYGNKRTKIEENELGPFGWVA